MKNSAKIALGRVIKNRLVNTRIAAVGKMKEVKRIGDGRQSVLPFDLIDSKTHKVGV